MSRYQKDKTKTSLDFLEQETVSGTGAKIVLKLENTVKFHQIIALPNSYLLSVIKIVYLVLFLQCFDAVGWAAGRASGL